MTDSEMIVSEASLDWTVWFDETNDVPVGPCTDTQDDFLERMVKAGTCSTYEAFRAVWRELCDGHGEPPVRTNIRVFRSGLKPLWEDPANVDGGKFVVCIGSKDGGPEKFLATVAALMASDLSDSQLLNGVVLSSRPWGHTLSLWHANAQPGDRATHAIESELRALVDEVNISFHSHRKTLSFHQNPEDASAKADGVAEKPAPPAVAEKPKQMPAAVDDMPVQPRVAARMSLRQRKSCTQITPKGSLSADLARLESKWGTTATPTPSEEASEQLSLLAALNPVHWSTTELVAALVASVAALGLVIVS